jgi:hypothetical protein
MRNWLYNTLPNVMTLFAQQGEIETWKLKN